jgi:hypothetical protein
MNVHTNALPLVLLLPGALIADSFPLDRSIAAPLGLGLNVPFYTALFYAVSSLIANATKE